MVSGLDRIKIKHLRNQRDLHMNAQQNHPLTGKKILISGASAGIGRETALLLANQGMQVLALGRRADALQALQDVAPAGSVRWLAGDLNDPAYLDALEPQLSEVDVFLNNAGVLRYAPIMDLTAEDFSWMFQTNVLASIQITQRVARHMVARRKGHLVFMTSIAAREVYRTASAYCATKHALSAMARSFRLELQDFGIKVSEIAPGMVDTDIRASSDHPVVVAAIQNRKFAPLSPAEVASAVLFALQSPSNFCPDLIELRPQGSV